MPASHATAVQSAACFLIVTVRRRRASLRKWGGESEDKLFGCQSGAKWATGTLSRNWRYIGSRSECGCMVPMEILPRACALLCTISLLARSWMYLRREGHRLQSWTSFFGRMVLFMAWSMSLDTAGHRSTCHSHKMHYLLLCCTHSVIPFHQAKPDTNRLFRPPHYAPTHLRTLLYSHLPLTSS